MLRFSRFAQANQPKNRGKSKETRSVSEGFFAFSNTPSIRYTTNTSVERHT